MEQNLSDAQRQAILNKRKELFAKMGVSNAGTVVTETVVNTGGASSNMAAKLAAIRNGSAKAELNKYITATSKGGGGSEAGFQSIPEPKTRKNPNHQETVKPEYKQELADFGGSSGPVNSELSMIDSMFGGDGPARMPSSGSYDKNPVNMQLDIEDAFMPSFNPQQALQNKMREKQKQTQSQQPQQNEYLKFASNTPPVQEDFEPIAQNGTVPFNVQNLQMMMEKIAKGIAEKTIKNVLSEYSEQQKQKHFFEYYNQKQGIIKTADGKLYKLTQVQLKQK